VSRFDQILFTGGMTTGREDRVQATGTRRGGVAQPSAVNRRREKCKQAVIGVGGARHLFEAAIADTARCSSVSRWRRFVSRPATVR